jgi:signal peptidase
MMDDRLIYPSGQDYISRNQIIGFVRGYIPFVGWVVIGLQRITQLQDMLGFLSRNFTIFR